MIGWMLSARMGSAQSEPCLNALCKSGQRSVWTNCECSLQEWAVLEPYMHWIFSARMGRAQFVPRLNVISQNGQFSVWPTRDCSPCTVWVLSAAVGSDKFGLHMNRIYTNRLSSGHLTLSTCLGDAQILNRTCNVIWKFGQFGSHCKTGLWSVSPTYQMEMLYVLYNIHFWAG